MNPRLPAYTTAFGVVALLAVGCGNSAPPVYPLSGKVTLGGKAYPRMICYFRPANGPADYWTIAVADTDAEGKIPRVRTNAGEGLPAGEYKVTFSCMVVKSTGAAIKEGEKPSELGVKTVELVPDEYLEGVANETTPARVTVNRQGSNEFTIDIPVKKAH